MEKMTPRERWLAVLNHQEPDRIPMDYWATPEVTKKLMEHLGCEEEKVLFKNLHVDKVIRVGQNMLALPNGQVLSNPPIGSKKNTDIFGCGFKEVSYGAGSYQECIYHPFAKYKTLEEIKRTYKWPNPDWYDYSIISDQIVGKEKYPIGICT